MNTVSDTKEGDLKEPERHVLKKIKVKKNDGTVMD